MTPPNLITEKEVKLTNVKLEAGAVNVKVTGEVNNNCYIYATLNFGTATYINTSFITDNRFGEFEKEQDI